MNQKTYLRAIIVALTMMVATVAATYLNLANAGEAELTWTHPTQYTDGTPIPAGVLVRTTLQYGLCNATANGLLASPAPVTVQVPYPAATRTITGLGAGKWCFAARSESATEQSAYTAYVNKTIVLVPAPPSGLTVAATVAYTVVKQRDRFVMLPVGTVPADTPCSTSQSVNGYYVVPRAAVTFTGSVQPEVVVAQCG